MSTFQAIRSPGAPAAVGPYSQAMAVGNLVFCSGQIPLVPGTKELKNETIEEATRQALSNLRAFLSSAGCSPCFRARA